MSGGRQARRRAGARSFARGDSLPIDYWDYLGWKDTLAIPAHQRQAYSKRGGDREVYTPQVGSTADARARQRQGRDRQAIAQTRKQGHALAAGQPVGCGEQISIRSGRQGHRRGRDLAVSDHKDAGHDRSGENSGHTITYHNVVRKWIKLGEWTGRRELHGPEARHHGRRRRCGRGGGAVRQQGSPGTMLGATVAALQ